MKEERQGPGAVEIIGMILDKFFRFVFYAVFFLVSVLKAMMKKC